VYQAKLVKAGKISQRLH